MTNVRNIGTAIFELRKTKGVTQDELAKSVGVSAQAVSKWENGGVPDIELLPSIADFFEVSVDELFGRSNRNIDITSAIFEHIWATESNSEERFKTIFELCWDIERAFFDFDGSTYKESMNSGRIKDYEKIMQTNEQRYSSIMSDHGFSRMGIANRLQYFLFVPEIKDAQTGLFDNIDYTKLFEYLSDKDIFNAFLLLFKRNSKKAFTENLFIKELGIDLDKTKEIISVLEKYYLIRKSQIELDDEVKDVYNFIPTPSFVGLLIFAREIVDPPRTFTYYLDGREKPYLT